MISSTDAPLVQWFQQRGGRRFSATLSFLATRPKLARVLANVFWIMHRAQPREATVTRFVGILQAFNRFLDYRAKSHAEVRSAKDISRELLQECAVWLVTAGTMQRKVAADLFQKLCLFLRTAKQTFPLEFDASMTIPKNLFAGADSEQTESKALPMEQYKKILDVAKQEVNRIRNAYTAGDYPASTEQIIPFMILLAARCAMNTWSVYELDRNKCLVRHEIIDTLYYCIWHKARANEMQKQAHRKDPATNLGVVELIEFVRKYTEPLLSMAQPHERQKLFLYLYSGPGTRKIICPGGGAQAQFSVQIRKFREKHQFPHFTLFNIRPSAATLLYLETGGNLRKVQHFLQHSRLDTTVRYVLNAVTKRLHTRVIQKAQHNLVRQLTVVPESRATGVAKLGLPQESALKILNGSFDTSSGVCANPFDSPQSGEVKGRMCTSFHKCYECHNGLWFLEDLPFAIANRDRMISFRKDMKPIEWDAVYGETVRILNEDIIGVFSAKQVRDATVKAATLKSKPLIIAKGVLG